MEGKNNLLIEPGQVSEQPLDNTIKIASGKVVAALAGLLLATSPTFAQEQNPLFSNELTVFGTFAPGNSQETFFNTSRGGVLEGEKDWGIATGVVARYTRSIGEIDPVRFGLSLQGSYEQKTGAFLPDRTIPETTTVDATEIRFLAGPTLSFNIPDTPFSPYFGAYAGVAHSTSGINVTSNGIITSYPKGSDTKLAWEAVIGTKIEVTDSVFAVIEGFIKNNPAGRYHHGGVIYGNDAEDSETGLRLGLGVKF